MKRIISFVIASAAVAMALVSCTKEIIVNKEAEKGINTDGTRTLTISFATKATKTDLSSDRKTPVWKEGDQISLNGTPYNVPAADVGTTSCTITTDIQGAITAVYPATAYQSAEPYFKVSDEQDGSFGCANICVAEAASGVNLLIFENVTAVFEVTVPEGTTKLTVTSLGKIDSETGQRGTAAEDKAAINTTGEGDAAKVITVEKSDKSAFEEDFVYVAVAVDTENGVLLADLNFDTGSAQGGVSPNYIKSKEQNPLEYKAAAGTIYTPVLHEYVVVGEGENARKWATMNVAATSATDNGDYFAWGETTGHAAATASSNAFVFGTNNAGFAWINCPYAVGGTYKFRKYVPSSKTNFLADDFPGDTKTVLDLKDDAAFWNWGGAWRMPTKEESNNLISKKEWDSTNNGYKFGTSPNQIFLSAAGYGYEATLYDASASKGYYWLSTLPNDSPKLGYSLKFVNNDAFMQSFERLQGMPVRALSK